MRTSTKNIFVGRFQAKLNTALPTLIIAFLSLLFLFVSLRRGIINYGTETDFLGGFVPEARRFLHNVPLQIEYHPPLYSIFLALFFSVLGDWLKSGLILSLLASLVVMITSYKFFTYKFGRTAGLGALLALAVSTTFISYSMQATSDIFFMALFFCSLVFIAMAEAKNTLVYWLLAGFFAGLSFLTRTNGITLIGFLFFTLVYWGKRWQVVRSATLFGIGFLIPVSIWLVFSTNSGAPFSPTSTYKNLAQNYFSGGDDRKSGDALNRASEGMHNVWDVIKKDPVYIAKSYVRDSFTNFKMLFLDDDLIPFPYTQLALLGIIVLLFINFNTFNLILFLNLIASFLLLSFKAWDNRFFLFLVPFLGAGIGALLSIIQSELQKRHKKTIMLVSALLLSAVFVIPRLRSAFDIYSNPLAFDSQKAAQELKFLPDTKSAMVVARKPHLGFYANLDWKFFPDVRNLDSLKSALHEMVASLSDSQRVFLFYGFAERESRPDLETLASTEFSAPWLTRFISGNENGGWVLYKVLLNRF